MTLHLCSNTRVRSAPPGGPAPSSVISIASIGRTVAVRMSKSSVRADRWIIPPGGFSSDWSLSIDSTAFFSPFSTARYSGPAGWPRTVRPPKPLACSHSR